MKIPAALLMSLLAIAVSPAHADAESTNRIAAAALSFDPGLFASPSAAALPAWIRSAGYEHGDVSGEPPAWHGAAAMPEGAGKVWIELNREALNEDLSLTLLYERNASADLAVQLCDAEGRVLALDLFQNALAIADQARTDTFIVPVRRFPSAARIVLRRISGDVKLYGAVLAPVVTEQPGELDVLLDLLKRLGDRLSPESDLVRRIKTISETQAASTNEVERPPHTVLRPDSSGPSTGVAARGSAGEITWRRADNFPDACGMLAATLADGKIFALGGYNFNWISAVRTMDPAKPAQGWAGFAGMPAGRACLAAVTAGGKIYAIGGLCDQMAQSSVFVLDLRGPEQGWSSACPLPTPLQRLAAVAVDDQIYVLGGAGSNGVQSAVYILDTRRPEGGWRLLNHLPSPRHCMAATVAGGKIYAIGGSDDHQAQSSVFAFDPAQPSSGWHEAGSLSEPRYALGAAVLNDKIYALGGFNANQTGVSTVDQYDLAQPEKGWRRVGDLPSVKGEAPAVAVDGRIYLLSGAVRPLTYEASIFEGRLDQ